MSEVLFGFSDLSVCSEVLRMVLQVPGFSRVDMKSDVVLVEITCKKQD